MKVLLVSPEVSPLAKTGGLGDVVGALPRALREAGVDARVLCPFHRQIGALAEKKVHPTPLTVRLAKKERRLGVVETLLPGSDVPVYLLRHKGLFDRPGIYAGPRGNYPDNLERSLVLCRAALALPALLGWRPDVHHAHDWMAATLPACLNALPEKDPLKGSASVLTIHNLEHQGIFSAEDFAQTGLPEAFFHLNGFEGHGNLNLLKGGISHSTKITTVSPTYAQEICTPTHGHGLDSSLAYRANDLIGILNGIDERDWDPMIDPALPFNFGVTQVEPGKQACREALLRETELPDQSGAPLFGVVSRLFRQKGLDLLASILPKLLKSRPMQLVLLGNGDRDEERSFLELERAFPAEIAVHIGFDEDLARRIYAGCDFFVMPSRFEPCGLAQQYAMRYGTLPVARRTGGLADTITSPDDAPSGATGLLFEKATERDLFTAMEHAILLKREKKVLAHMRRNAMTRESSWVKSAERYSEVYRWAQEVRGRSPCGDGC